MSAPRRPRRPTRISEPSSWVGMASMALGMIPVCPESMTVPLAASAVAFGLIGLLMREWPNK